MRLREIYERHKPAFSFEFFPPKTDKGEESLLKHVEVLKTLSPAFFSMTYGAGGSTREKTVSLGDRIRKSSGVETMCHVTCVGQSRGDVHAVIADIKSRGMENIMALRGDPPRGAAEWTPHPDGYHHAIDLVKTIRKMDGLSAAVAGFPETHPEAVNREADLRFLKEKVDAGADAVICQLFFDNEDFLRFEREARAAGIKVPIVPGIMPVLSVPQIRKIADLSKVRIPEGLEQAFRAVEGNDELTERVGRDYAANQIAGLLKHGVPGVHIYCLNRSETPLAIFKALGLLDRPVP